MRSGRGLDVGNGDAQVMSGCDMDVDAIAVGTSLPDGMEREVGDH